MMFEEFVKRCVERHIPEPTIEAYTDIIEPVYNYHPVFDGNFAKDRCADLYAAGGIGLFRIMREQAEQAKLEEQRVEELRHEFEKIARQYETACASMKACRESVRNEWRCAE